MRSEGAVAREAASCLQLEVWFDSVHTQLACDQEHPGCSALTGHSRLSETGNGRERGGVGGIGEGGPEKVKEE